MVQTREEDLMSARCCDGYQSSISLGCIDGTGSIQCLRRQLAQKDRELEQANKRADNAEVALNSLHAKMGDERDAANKRADEAEAKLALVKEWAGRKHTISTRPSVESAIDNISTVLSSFDELDAILADTPEVIVCHACDNDGDASVFVGPSLPFVGYEIKAGDTVTVTRRNGDNGSGE